MTNNQLLRTWLTRGMPTTKGNWSLLFAADGTVDDRLHVLHLLLQIWGGTCSVCTKRKDFKIWMWSKLFFIHPPCLHSRNVTISSSHHELLNDSKELRDPYNRGPSTLMTGTESIEIWLLYSDCLCYWSMLSPEWVKRQRIKSQKTLILQLSSVK